MLSSSLQLVNNADEPFGQQEEKEQAVNKFDYTPMADICVCNSLVENMPMLIVVLDTI